MPKFIYQGETIFENEITKRGPTVAIKYLHKDGSITRIDAPDQAKGFVKGQLVDVDVNDARTLRALLADPRFKELGAP